MMVLVDSTYGLHILDVLLEMRTDVRLVLKVSPIMRTKALVHQSVVLDNGSILKPICMLVLMVTQLVVKWQKTDPV